MRNNKFIIISPADNVATAMFDLQAGETFRIQSDAGDRVLELKQSIQAGHKVAITEITMGTNVIKYGYSIGKATQDIAAGAHVHIHNVDSCRGRGDLSLHSSMTLPLTKLPADRQAHDGEYEQHQHGEH